MATDIKLGSGGNFVTTDGDYEAVTGVAEVAQAVNFALLTIRGESAYDVNLGVRWFDVMFNTNVSLSEKEFEIRGVILSTPGVETLDSLVFEVDPVIRTARINYTVTTTFGVASDIEVTI